MSTGPYRVREVEAAGNASCTYECRCWEREETKPIDVQDGALNRSSGRGASRTFPANQPLSYASCINLFTVDDNGQFQPASAEQVIEVALVTLDEKLMRVGSITAPEDAGAFFALRLGQLEHEVFAVIFMDAQHRVIEYIELFRGTLTQTSVYPREVVKTALRLNAAAVIFGHNHPSGVPEPSRADENLTKTLKDVLAQVDVRVLDHVVIAGGASISFAQRGLL